jgi:flagellar hook-length control protein FliK
MPLLPTTLAARSNMDTEAAPTTTLEVMSETPGKSAEIAAEQDILAAIPAANSLASERPEPIEPEKNFDALLASAQTLSQQRNAGVHPANSPGAALPVHTPVGTRGWDGDVGDKLVWMVGRREQRAELVLNPPQMGRIEVSLSMNDGQTSALFVSANPAVRDALEAALPRLREILADAGVNLGQTQVGADTGNGAGNSSTNSAENRDNSGRGLSTKQLPRSNEILRQLDAPQWLKRGNGLVDIFA